jgi:two-component system response regulator YesN
MVIADDELLIRQGLQTISWTDYGIEIKGIASNGTEALSLIECTFPEILLTDIRMPGMDGLRLIQAAKKLLPDIKSILLTGYQDFGYAHSAIQLGAMGYILKPSDPDEIIRTVLKAKEQVDAEQAEKRSRERIRQQIDGVQNILIQSFLTDLLYGRITDAAVISETCRKYDICFSNAIVLLVEAGLEGREPDGGLMPGLKEEIRGVLSDLNTVYTVDMDSTSVCAVIEFPAAAVPEQDIVLSMAAGVRNHLESLLGIHAGVGTGMYCRSASELHRGYLQALNAIRTGTIPARNATVKNILDFIESRFMEDITLLMASEHVYMNHIYLSRLIKKETGENFIDILTRARLRKACEMLRETSLKTYEISEMVGIKDSGYFSQVFKKRFGVTPSEYRENALSSTRSKG